MKLKELITRLMEIEHLRAREGTTVDVMVEVNEPAKCQYQFPVNGVAYSKDTNTIVIMHEKFNGEDL